MQTAKNRAKKKEIVLERIILLIWIGINIPYELFISAAMGVDLFFENLNDFYKKSVQKYKNIK